MMFQQNWLLPPKLQRGGLVFEGKLVTMERMMGYIVFVICYWFTWVIRGCPNFIWVETFFDSWSGLGLTRPSNTVENYDYEVSSLSLVNGSYEHVPISCGLVTFCDSWSGLGWTRPSVLDKIVWSGLQFQYFQYVTESVVMISRIWKSLCRQRLKKFDHF